MPGGAGAERPAARPRPAQFLKALEWNVLPAYALTRARRCRQLRREPARGSVINITSAAARYAQRSFSGYGTAKAALTAARAAPGTGLRASGAGQRDRAGTGGHRRARRVPHAAKCAPRWSQRTPLPRGSATVEDIAPRGALPRLARVARG
jgi:hypothetical protein